MMHFGVRRATCGLCGQEKWWLGDNNSIEIRTRVCHICDAPCVPKGWPPGFLPATWELNLKHRMDGNH